jgi:hypothetical protein
VHADLAAPGGAFEQLQAVSRKTTSLTAFLAYCRAAHSVAGGPRGAYAEVLDERLKARWANASFTTWSRGHAILEGFWARICAGRLEDGTAGVWPVILYGAAQFASSSRGRRPGPTTSMRHACVTVCGAAWVRDANEHRSSKCCSGCGCVLEKVWALTPERIYEAAAAREANALPLGWKRPPPRPIATWRIVRGLLHCGQDECRSRSLHHRDKDACRSILNNALSVDAGHGTLPYMEKGQHNDNVPPVFYLWPH